jgi:hypothetical protein
MHGPATVSCLWGTEGKSANGVMRLLSVTPTVPLLGAFCRPSRATPSTTEGGADMYDRFTTSRDPT